MPRTGLRARSTLMFSKMCGRPATARNANHSVMMGPKALPILEVPAFCRKKSTLMMQMTMAMTICCPSPMSRWRKSTVRRPSIAVVTVTAGVRMPSAKSAAPPIMAGMMSQRPHRLTRL